jgi:hypothetical protein
MRRAPPTRESNGSNTSFLKAAPEKKDTFIHFRFLILDFRFWMFRDTDGIDELVKSPKHVTPAPY